jgi:hypothetical protein
MGAGAVTVGLGGTSSAVLAGVTISGLQAGTPSTLPTFRSRQVRRRCFRRTSGISVGVNRYELGLDSSTDLTGDQLRVANDGTGHAEINIAATPQDITFAPTATNAYLSEVTPFLTGNGASLLRELAVVDVETGRRMLLSDSNMTRRHIVSLIPRLCFRAAGSRSRQSAQCHRYD